jgi:hypothetical protein
MTTVEVKQKKTKKKASPILKMWQNSQAIREAIEQKTPTQDIEKALEIRFINPL